MPPTSQNGRHPTTFRARLPVTTMLLLRRARELERQLPLAIQGNDTGVHQARVASRRLREAVPVLAGETKARRKAEKKIRKLTQALGTVREMDVTVQILDEFAQTNALPRNALEDVRAHVIAERDRRRAVMLQRLRRVDTDRLRARLEEASIVAAVTDSAEWREALTTQGGSPGQTAHGGDPGGGADVRGRTAARRAYRDQEAALRARVDRRRAAGSRPSARQYAQARPGHPGQAARPAGHRAARGRGAGDAAGAPGGARRRAESDCRQPRATSAGIFTAATSNRRRR